MLMERTAEVIRGWPYDGSLDLNEQIASGVTVRNGDWVTLDTDGKVVLAGSTPTRNAGLVIQGNGDSLSAKESGKAVVIWGNVIVRVSNFTAGSYAPGTEVTVKDGKLAVAGSSDPVIGFVRQVASAVAGKTTASITVVIR